MPSFEETIAAHTAALNRHSDVMEKFIKAGSGGSAGGASSGKPSSGAATGSASSGKANKGPTLEDIQKKFGDYMSVTDKEVRNERKAHVLNIAGKFGAERATAIDPKHFKEALELLAQYEAGEDPFADEDAGEEASPI